MQKQPGIVGEALFHGIVADEIVERVGRLDELDETAGLSLDQVLLELLERVIVELLARMSRARQEPLQVHEIEAARQLGELFRREVGEIADLPILAVVPGDVFFSGLDVGNRDFKSRHVGAADEPLVELREPIAEEADGDIATFDVGILRPGEEPDESRTLGADHLAEIGRRQQELRMVEDQADADLVIRIRLHEILLDELIDQAEDAIGVLGPHPGLADPRFEQPDHLS